VTISDLKANAATQGEIIGRQQKQIELLLRAYRNCAYSLN